MVRKSLKSFLISVTFLVILCVNLVNSYSIEDSKNEEHQNYTRESKGNPRNILKFQFYAMSSTVFIISIINLLKLIKR